jgi:hypothetical protein
LCASKKAEKWLRVVKGLDRVEHMFDMVRMEAGLREAVKELDGALLDGDAALELVGAFDRIERLAAAGKAITGHLVATSGAWRGVGARDAIGFIANRHHEARGRVRDALGVASNLDTMPELGKAFRAGALTVGQAADIAAVVAEHPEAEVALVELAPTLTARQLKERCVELLAQGEGAEQQHRRARAERSGSSNVGRDGIWRLGVRLPVIDGALVDKALDHFQTQVFDQARSRGEREPYDAYRADALVAMAQAAMDPGQAAPTSAPGGKRSGRRRGRGRSSSIRHALVITVPHSVFGPGGPAPGDTCQVPGVGPVPLSVVHRLMDDDPIVKAVVTKGRDITAVATLTRSIKDDLRLAVLAANDLTCAVPGCQNRRFLELDHRHEFHKGGPTSYENLRPLCSFHHDLRTNFEFELRGRPGSYEWVAPDGTVLAAERSADPLVPDRAPPPVGRGAPPPGGLVPV